jgi:hypothetical protein
VTETEQFKAERTKLAQEIINRITADGPHDRGVLLAALAAAYAALCKRAGVEPEQARDLIANALDRVVLDTRKLDA